MFELHIISYPDFFEGESEIINTLLSSGDVFFHLRKPNATEKEYLDLVSAIEKKHYSHMFLHACYDLSLQHEFAGCHYAVRNRYLANTCGCKTFKSTSCHSLSELSSFITDYDQFLLSPIYDSISKSGYLSQFSAESLIEFLENKQNANIIALGGICLNNVIDIKHMGFDGAAVLGAVWGTNPSNMEAVLKRFKSVYDVVLNEQ